jgi:hypothetical protein
MTDDADRAAKTLIAAFRLLADRLPGMHEKQVAPGVISLMSGLPMATLNGVCTDLARALPGVVRHPAYLASSEEGYPLYQSMGCRTVETWTYLSTEPGA